MSHNQEIYMVGICEEEKGSLRGTPRGILWGLQGVYQWDLKGDLQKAEPCPMGSCSNNSFNK